MRTIPCAMMSAILVLAGAAGMAGPAAAIQAEKVGAPNTGTTGTVTLRATATFSDGTSADRLYRVTLDSDSDGDGVGDEVWLRVACSRGAVTSAQSYSLSGHGGAEPRSGVASVRDSGSAMVGGKRQHGSVVIIKEWDRTAIVGQRVSWDLKEAKGAKTMAADSWHHRTVRDGAAQLCG